MDKEAILENFKSASGLDETASTAYLDMFDWNMDNALSFFLEQNQDEPKVNTPSPQTQSSYQSYKKSTPSNQGKMMGLNDLNKSDEDDQTNKYYAGGSKGSGIQIQDPKKNLDNLVKDVFQKAKDNSEEYVPEEKDKFEGFSGYSLGSSNVVKNEKKPEPTTRKITFYKNGFIIDDGPLRSYSEPSSQSFLEDVSKGIIPKELEVLGGTAMNIDLIDNKNEEYKEKPKPVNYFEGSGYSLDTEKNTTGYITSGQNVEYVLDESKPKTSIQIRFHDGKKAVGKFNLDHTVKHLCAWIEKTQNLAPNTKYELMHSFPPKPLTNLNLTIKEAGLSGESIVQKLL